MTTPSVRRPRPRYRSTLLALGGLLLVLAATAVVEAQPAKKNGPAAAKAPATKVTAAKSPVAAPVSDIPQATEIDRQIEAQWKENRIAPSSRAGDYEFLRRVSLDVIGRIPTLDEINLFMNDKGTSQARRARLIDRLLTSPEFAENWASIWSVWMLTRTSPRSPQTGRQTYRDQLQLWLNEQFGKPGHGWDKIVYDLLTATGPGNENGAVNYILSHVGETIPRDDARAEGTFNFVPLTSRTSRLFLGLQIQCAQCHDHKTNPQWKQRHFWGLSAFFRPVQRVGGNMMANNRMDLPQRELRENTYLNTNNTIIQFENNRAIRFATRAAFLDRKGKGFDPASHKTRRQQLAEYITTDDYFAKAYVNRMWGHFFGRGLTVNGKDVDDFGEHNAEIFPLTGEAASSLRARHPEKFKDKEPTLLDYLAEEFRTSPTNLDPRALVRWICNSRAYNLTSVANGTIEVVEEEEVAGKGGEKKKAQKKRNVANDRAEAEPFFSRMQLKAMSPEQLFESLWVSTYANPHATKKRTGDERRRLRDEWMRRLTSSFGDDEGNEVTYNGTVVQALLLMNSREINEAIEDKGGPVPVARQLAQRRAGSGLAAFGKALAEELYLATLNRKPTKDELDTIFGGGPKKKEPYIALMYANRDPLFWDKAAQDLMWALLNSSEFILNH